MPGVLPMTASEADDWWTNRLESKPARDPLIEQLELDADAGRIGWHEIGDRLAAARAAMSAFQHAEAA